MNWSKQNRSGHPRRMKRMAITLMLSVVAGGVGLTYADHAGAKTVGFVYVKVNGKDTNAKAHWGEAWSQCRSRYPQTRSVHYNFTSQQYDPKNPGTSWWAQEWTCDDQS